LKKLKINIGDVLNSDENLGEKVEDKFKFALLQVDKRLVNLELAIGEISEKIKNLKSIDAETINAIKERLDELEDLVMVENLGEIELKRFFENIESKTNDLSQKTNYFSEELKKIETLETKIEQIKNLEEEIVKLKEKVEPIETSILKNLKEEIADLKEKSEKLALKEDLEKIEKNVKEIDEKISGIFIPTQEIINLADKVLALEGKIKLLEDFKEDFDPIRSEIIKLKEKLSFFDVSSLEKISKLEKDFIELDKKISQLALKTEELASKPETSEILNKKIEELEEKINLIPKDNLEKFENVMKQEMEEKIKAIRDDIEKNENKIDDLNKKFETLSMPNPEIVKLDEKLNQLNLKIEDVEKIKGEIDAIKKEIETLESSILKKVNEDSSTFKNNVEEKLKLIEGKNSELNEKLKSMETSLSKNVEEKISSLSSFSEKISSLSEELSKLKEENSNFGKRIEQISNIENEIKSLNERIKLLEGQIIQRVASEISDLRMETSGEIKEIKDKISGITATKSEIDIKFLSSRLNSLKENVDYLLNRKVEFDMKLDDFQKALTKLAEKVEDIESMSFATTTVEERIRALEEKMEKMPDEIFNNLKNAISQLPSVRQQKFKAETEKPDLDSDIKKLLEKLSFLESKIMSLEEDVKSSGSGKALIVE